MMRLFSSPGNIRSMTSKRVYFGKLPRDCRDRDLEKLCKEFGRTRDVRLLQGFGFVEFEDSRDAEDCVKELHDTRFLGDRIIVEIAKGGRDRRDRSPPPRNRDPKNEHRLQILGLPDRTSWQDLKDLMRKAGEVQYTNIEGNGDGIVEFIYLDGKDKALDMFADYDYQGSTLTLKEVESSGRNNRDRDDRRDGRDDRGNRGNSQDRDRRDDHRDSRNNSGRDDRRDRNDRRDRDDDRNDRKRDDDRRDRNDDRKSDSRDGDRRDRDRDDDRNDSARNDDRRDSHRGRSNSKSPVNKRDRSLSPRNMKVD